ncbi:MAG TPA: recombinase family protein [Pirellulales bacterium]|jgi:DNA invertase Pin-like site-specific DNA recombinase
MTAILGYARVSTAGQDLEGQRQRLSAAGAIRVFEDVTSGRNFKRPGLSSLLEYARTGDVLCIVRLDRLGRSLRELLNIVDTLKQRGIGLMSLDEKLDTSSAAGELAFHVFAAVGHFERGVISERTRDGLAVARVRGKRIGRPILDETKIAAALRLVDAGLTPAQASQQVGLGRSTVYRELRTRNRSRQEMPC